MRTLSTRFRGRFAVLVTALAMLIPGLIPGPFDPNAARAENPPNVVMIMLDDLGFKDLGAYGGDYIRTPVIDDFFHEASRFWRYYSAGAVCTPTRFSMLTGLDPARYGISSGVFGTSRALLQSYTTLPEVLSAQGYTTGHTGKWHLGVRPITGRPEYHGYDHVRMASSNVDYWSPTFIADGVAVDHPGEHLTQVTTDYANEFIEVNTGDPFFLTVWYNAPHTPYTETVGGEVIPSAPQEFIDDYGESEAGLYAAMVAHADQQIGRILDTLDAQGLADNTIVMISSDNGGTINKAPYESNGALRFGKASLFEGGIRVPLLVRWPSNVPAGITNRSMVTSTDLMPTVLDLVGIDTSRFEFDGVSTADLMLSGNSRVIASRPVFWETAGGTQLTRPRFDRADGEWNSWAVRDGRWKLIFDPVRGRYRLFDVILDPRESRDMADEKPGRVALMAAKYRQWQIEIGAIDIEVDERLGGARIDPFEFVGDGGVTLADPRSFDNGGGEYSVFARVTLPDGPISGRQVIASQAGAWVLWVGPSGIVKLRVFDDDRGRVTLRSTTRIGDGLPHDLAFTTYDWATSKADIRLWVDGNFEWRRSDVIDQVARSARPVTIGSTARGQASLIGRVEAFQVARQAYTLEELALLSASTNSIPTGEIVVPADGASVTAAFDTGLGEFAGHVRLRARAQDPDGDSVSIDWISSDDGPLGTGAVVDAVLTLGGSDSAQPVITARFTDSRGAVYERSIRLIVSIPSS